MTQRSVFCLGLLLVLPLAAAGQPYPDVAPGLWRIQHKQDTSASSLIYLCLDGAKDLWDRSPPVQSCLVGAETRGSTGGSRRVLSTRLDRKDWAENGGYRSLSTCRTDIAEGGRPPREFISSVTERTWQGDFSRRIDLKQITTVTVRSSTDPGDSRYPQTRVVDSSYSLTRLGQCPVSMLPGSSCSNGQVAVRCGESLGAEIRHLESSSAGRN